MEGFHGKVFVLPVIDWLLNNFYSKVTIGDLLLLIKCAPDDLSVPGDVGRLPTAKL